MANDFSEKIELSGFKDIDEPAISDLKRIAASYVKRFSEICGEFEKLTIRMKKVHAQVHSEKYEVHISVLDKGKLFTSAVTDKNLLNAADAALQKVEHEIGEK
ncbi:hypothetical protein HYV83_01590 [Candidatus Woesearchaeota archaeon]|nr:hypothetical protein [Candidatus Woesearchaeota archaeon]